MHIKEALINFLYDKEYFISMYDNCIYIYNYQELVELKSDKIILKMPKFVLNIYGSNLFITKMLPNEILIKGLISNIGIDYE